jgi:hypothetical protein
MCGGMCVAGVKTLQKLIKSADELLAKSQAVN